ncbi:lipid-A-disaccharide synthase [Rhodopirellula sp. MGV]|uniref:lipid-A-disaccharide synthase n=1 Tax=Rhodopirellula sp. MGV TaxID=2023130 RepID=UPI000B96D725|nr:lipid-A-disaccharide synthase [Rhodopirellula sp. MGV]OYP34953.1 lipid-A-disaccharide synthase [Rhodopirellula sp. MGV]PNY38152.1 lipid-A-disaccharide synthase [Rhodopirellula baltica]
MSKTIFFSVGEPSGDEHAAHLIEVLRERQPDLRVRGFGGREMRRAGCDVDLDLTEHAVVGILEVLPKLRQFFRFVDDAEAIFATGEIDAVVLVDFPGFNWHIAKRAKKYGIPVYYYCPPQLWAWASWRIRKMKATVDHVLAVLPIEQQFFSEHQIPTTFVGHPFFDAVDQAQLSETSIASIRQSAADGPTVAVLPGSRTAEVFGNWPVMLSAIAELSEQHPKARFAVAGYRDKHLQFCKDEYQRFVNREGRNLPIDFYQGATSEIIDQATCAMMVSGSVSLELMARQTPAVVMYRVGRFLYAFGRCVVKVDSVTLPNLMPDPESDSRPFPEMISVGNPAPASQFLVDEIGRLLADDQLVAERRQQLARLNRLYAQTGASVRAADKLLELLDHPGAIAKRVA